MAVALATLSGCVLWMRDSDFYTAQVGELLETREDAIAACYDRVLSEVDPEARGELIVEFDVEKGSGALTNITVAERSSAPEPLAACVTDELAQMRLEPPDSKTAHASFTWMFAPGSRKQPPADPFAGAQDAVLACYSTHLAEVDREAEGVLVVDYAFNRNSGLIERLEVVEEVTTAPGPVVECATVALSAARPDPGDLEDRNAVGRRSFALRFEPYQEREQPG